MARPLDVLKRVVLGRALRSERLGETLLSKRIALPIFSSDALSSVAYAPQEIIIVLTLAGTSFLYLTPYLAAAVVFLMIVVVASYRQLVRAYPSGGGDYEVATKNIKPLAGVVVAAALLIDYVMTVAVSVSSGVDNLISAFPDLHSARVGLAVGIVAFLAAMNLRGVRESGSLFAIPTYAFIGGIMIMIVTGAIRIALGHDFSAESANYTIKAQETGLTGIALMFFVLRAFSSGCAALTGVEAIANGVPAFREPKADNAAKTLLLMGTVAVTMFFGIAMLAVHAGVKITDPSDTCDITNLPEDCNTYAQRTIIAQVSSAVFGSSQSPMFYFIQGATALILVLAANTAFNGFPLLGSVLAQDRWLPRQLHTRGDRLVFSNGIIFLAAMASILIVIYDANVTKLIQLYIIGVFISFTLGQSGMVRHWNRLIPQETDPAVRSRMLRSRIINATGATISGLVLVIVTVTKFSHGAYLVVIALPLLFLLMRGIHKHYTRVSAELQPTFDEETTLPSRNHAIVLVSKIHKPTLRALAYARATRPSTLEALTVQVDPAETKALQQEWIDRGLPVELKVLQSPYREVTKPVLDYVKNIRRKSPRDVVTVFIPEYVVGHWWEQLLHNQSALRLKGRLLFTPGVMVTSVAWQLESSDRRAAERLPGGLGRLQEPDGETPGDDDAS